LPILSISSESFPGKPLYTHPYGKIVIHMVNSKVKKKKKVLCSSVAVKWLTLTFAPFITDVFLVFGRSWAHFPSFRPCRKGEALFPPINCLGTQLHRQWRVTYMLQIYRYVDL
jgi:hypothetical protein